MRLRHIEVFHAIYTSGSITNAAKLLHVSQPSVSKVLSHAEMQLGFELFKRIKGRLVPTNEAELLFDEVDKIYQQLNTIKNSADNIKNNEVGRVSIAITPALGFNILPKAIAEFRSAHPDIIFDIKTLHNDELQKHLARHQSEVAIMFSPQQTSGIQQKLFGQGKMVAVYPKALIPNAPQTLSLKELLQYPLVSIWDSGPLADISWQRIQSENLQPINTIKVHTYFIAVSLVKQGIGVCLVDEFTAKSQLDETIGIAELSDPIEFSIKGLFLEKKPLSHAAEEFLGFISDSLRN